MNSVILPAVANDRAVSAVKSPIAASGKSDIAPARPEHATSNGFQKELSKHSTEQPSNDERAVSVSEKPNSETQETTEVTNTESTETAAADGNELPLNGEQLPAEPIDQTKVLSDALEGEEQQNTGTALNTGAEQETAVVPDSVVPAALLATAQTKPQSTPLNTLLTKGAGKQVGEGTGAQGVVGNGIAGKGVVGKEVGAKAIVAEAKEAGKAADVSIGQWVSDARKEVNKGVNKEVNNGKSGLTNQVAASAQSKLTGESAGNGQLTAGVVGVQTTEALSTGKSETVAMNTFIESLVGRTEAGAESSSKGSTTTPGIAGLTTATTVQANISTARAEAAAVPTVPLASGAAFGTPGWSNAVANRVTWLMDNRMMTAELRLDPPDLGPLSVKIAMGDGQAQVSFVSQSGDVRSAIDQSIAKLRELFEERNIDLVDVDISDQSASQETPEEQLQAEHADGSTTTTAAADLINGDDSQQVYDLAPQPLGLVDQYV